eukprot:TRINITY_DN2935_c0_g1_i2.p2 TRINITY_DN2935_c0_g1~~TRINITY_DN2935_c0_g1_i2.p2  ORF type:complete len:116 (+),score=13.67 TRINITY_DN2935_c0_g1_i2:20-367(+)
MGDTNRRVSLLFASVGTAVLTTVFLHWYPKPKPTKRSLVASSSILDNGYDSEDFSDDIEHPVDQPVDHPSLIDNWKRPPTATDKYVSLCVESLSLEQSISCRTTVCDNSSYQLDI